MARQASRESGTKMPELRTWRGDEDLADLQSGS
jgi:hypothetical protein